jgi:hypothetical protein
MARAMKINIFGLLIVFLGLAAGLIYYTGLIAPEVPMAPATYPDLLQFKTMRLNFSVLDETSFDNLETFGEIPVEPGATGRDNIFAPF